MDESIVDSSLDIFRVCRFPQTGKIVKYGPGMAQELQKHQGRSVI